MSMKVSLRILVVQALAVVLCISTIGCTGADDTKITKVAPPAPPTEAEKAVPKSKPAGYGEGGAYQKAMEKAATR
jgi:hypothetical protein